MHILLRIHDDKSKDCTSVALGSDGIYVNIAQAGQPSAPQDLMDCVIAQYQLAKTLRRSILRDGDTVGGGHLQEKLQRSAPPDCVHDL